MTHHRQVLGQVYSGKYDNIDVRRRFAEKDHEEGFIYVYEYVSKTKCKKLCRRLYTLYKDMKKQDAYQYALLYFPIDDDYMYPQTPSGKSSRCNKLYIKLMKRTINKLKEAGIKQKPKASLHQVSQELGSSSSSGQQPKNYNQASSARNIAKSRFISMTNPVDDLLQAIYLCKKPNENFVKEVQSAPEGMCVIASDAQLNDISRFCAIPKPGVAEVMSVDLTLKLGEYYVLVTSFKNPMLVNKLGKHPTHIGPIQIQHRKLLSSYRYFGSFLKICDPKLGSLKAFSSDDEENIVKAFLAEFLEAVNVQCFRHFRRTIGKRLRKWRNNDGNEVCACELFSCNYLQLRLFNLFSLIIRLHGKDIGG